MEELRTKFLNNKNVPTTVEELNIRLQEVISITQDLFKLIEKLICENNDLKERLSVNSSNSSLPSSKDYKKKNLVRSRSNRPSGGQVGHKGSHREMLNTSEVDQVMKCFLRSRCHCGGDLQASGDYQRHQVFELPTIKLQVTEYQLAKGACLRCKQKQIASLPKGVTFGITGPKLTSLMMTLVSKYQLSRRFLQEFLKEQYGFSLSLGTVFNKQKLMVKILGPPAELLLEEVKKSSCINVDETGHNHWGKKYWQWGLLSNVAAFFVVMPSRGKKVLRSLAGDYEGIVISDRYTAYNLFESERRQLCWAHLKRDFKKLSEKNSPVIARIGRALLEQESKLFGVWYEFKNGKIRREELILRCKPIRHQIGECLERGSYTDPTLKAARFCKNLLNQFYALWTFLFEEGVEPTNNHAERGLRPSVIWRKRYLATYSEYGAKFVGISSSILFTCKLQAINAFEYIHSATTHFFSGESVPPLIIDLK